MVWHTTFRHRSVEYLGVIVTVGHNPLLKHRDVLLVVLSKLRIHEPLTLSSHRPSRVGHFFGTGTHRDNRGNLILNHIIDFTVVGKSFSQ